jgi:integrase
MSTQILNEGYSHPAITHPCIIELPAGQRIHASDKESLRQAIEVLLEVGINVHFPALPGPFETQKSGPPPLPIQTSTSLLPTSVNPSKLFSYYKELYLSGIYRSDVIDATYGYKEFVLTFFEDLVGDKPILDINEKDVDIFIHGLAHLPPRTRVGKENPGMTYRSIVARAEREKTQSISKGTQGRYFSDLKTFFNQLLSGKVITSDPTALVRKKDFKVGKTKTSFSTEDLINIFDSKHDPSLDEPHKYWGPLVCLHSALRINELMQLYIADVVDIAGIWCFCISSDRDGQNVKTKNSIRYVPVHSKLIELGLLEYVEELRMMGHVLLFPGLTWGANGPAGNVSIWFNRYHLRKRCGITDRKKSLHVFRHTFGTLSAKSGVYKRITKKVFGHSDGDNDREDTLDRYYVDPADVPECKDGIEKINFPPIQFIPYKVGRFETYLRKELAKQARAQRRVEDGKRQRRNKKASKAA